MSRLIVPVIIAGCGFVALAAWALATPPYSAPDDDYHLPSLWCAWGQSSSCEPGPDPGSRLVPPRVAGSHCYVGDATVSAACIQDLPDTPQATVLTKRGNWDGGYPGLFYRVGGLVVGDDVDASIVRVRLLNAALAVLALGLAARQLPRRLRHLVLLPSTVAVVPLALFIIPSTNPSSWTIVAALVAWPALYAALETVGPTRWSLLGVYLLGVVLAAGSRADGALFTGLFTIIVLGLKFREIPHRRVEVGAAVLGLAACMYSVLASGQSRVAGGGFGPYPDPGLSSFDLFFSNLRDLPTILFGSFGFGALGTISWFDTAFASGVPGLTMIALLGVWFVGLADMSRAKGIALGVLGAAVVLFPLEMLQQTNVLVGVGIQPRYVLPLVLAFLAFTLLPARRGRLVMSGAQQVVLVSAVTLAQSMALGSCLRRYVTGYDVRQVGLDAHREWWWHTALTPTAVWLTGSMAFAVFAFLATRGFIREDLADGDGPATPIGGTPAPM